MTHTYETAFQIPVFNWRNFDTGQKQNLKGENCGGSSWGVALGARGAQARSSWGTALRACGAQAQSRAALLTAFEICRPAINVGDGLE